MSEATLSDHLARLVRTGAVVGGTRVGGYRMSPSPIDYLAFDGQTVTFWWLGEETQLHTHEVLEVLPGQDGAVLFRTSEGHELTVEPIWDPRDAARLSAWLQIGGPSARAYPEGGWRYGEPAPDA